VDRETRFSWLKDLRVRGAIVAGVLAGFILGLLIFGEPWHLSPNFGDVPTWMLTILAAIAGWVGLDQLRILREQIAEDADRNEKRDQLLDRQLAEAEARSNSYRRMQAEEVKVLLRWDNQVPSVHVFNGSPRPITDITSKLVTKSTGQPAGDPDWAVITVQINSGEYVPAPGPNPQQRIDELAPGEKGVFRLGSPRDQGQILVAWFTDDAGFRWLLDELQHLAPTTGDEYKP
jgi:hypothetical protein